MAITVNIYYKGVNGNAKKFAEEMIASGVVDDIRAEEEISGMSISSRWQMKKQFF